MNNGKPLFNALAMMSILVLLAACPQAVGEVASRRLRPMPQQPADMLRFDLTGLPQPAKVWRADLLVFRTRELTGNDAEAMTPIQIIPNFGGEVAEKPLLSRGPWFDRLDATEAVRAWLSGKTNGGFNIRAFPLGDAAATCLDITFEGKSENVPAQVKGAKAFHRAGQTFIVFEELDDRSAEAAPSWGELKQRLTRMDSDRMVRYRIYRHSAPITTAWLPDAEWLADVKPMSGYNVIGRSVDPLIALHRRRAIDDMDFARQLARNNYFEKYHPDMPEMDQVPIQRLAVDDGAPLPVKMGLYVHQPDKAGQAHYAVVAVVDGIANMRDIAPIGPIEEAVGPGRPVLQGKPQVTVFFDYPGERRQYVQWAAPPLAHLPNQYYNWGVFIPRGYDQSPLKRLSIFFHDATSRYLKPPWPHRQDTVLLSPHDAPYRSYGYGHHEALGSLRSLGEGEVRPFFARRVDAMLDWALSEFKSDPGSISCGGAGYWGGTAAIQYGLRRPGRVACVMAEQSPDPDPRQTPYEFSVYGQGDKRATERSRMDAVWGKPEWAIPAETGKSIWDEMNLVAFVQEHGHKRTLPFLSLGAGSQHLTWKQETDLMRACQATHNAFMAEFFWGSSNHLHLPVGVEEGEHPFDPRSDRAVLACSSRDRSPNPDFFAKHYETGQRGYSGGGRLNTQPRWASEVDEPDRVEFTIYAAKRIVYAGRATCDVAVRNTQRFRPAHGEKLAWTVIGPRDPRPQQQGEASVDDNGRILIQGLIFGEPGRLIIRRAAK